MSLLADLLCAADPVEFCRSKLGFPADEPQQAILRDPAPQIVVTACRQFGKTKTLAVKGLHTAIYRPGSLVLAVAPSLRQSRLWFSAAIEFIRRLELGDVDIIEQENISSCTLKNKSKIVALPGDPVTIRGYSSPALVVVDEAAFLERDAALMAAITPMLAVSRGQLVLSSSANGMRGVHFEAAINGGDAWSRHTITADDFDRIDPAWLEQKRQEMPEWLWRQEFYCEFASAASQFFQFDTIRAAFDANVRPLWPAGELARIAAGAT